MPLAVLALSILTSKFDPSNNAGHQWSWSHTGTPATAPWPKGGVVLCDCPRDGKMPVIGSTLEVDVGVTTFNKVRLGIWG
jgi:hypothetical protein